MKHLFVFLFFSSIFSYALTLSNEVELDCEHDESIDISGGKLNYNYSITHNGKLYRFGLYSMNYTIDENGKKKIVEARACADALPCDYFESIDITGGTLDQNGTMIFEHMEFPQGTYAKVTYTLKKFHKIVLDAKNETIGVAYYTRAPKPEYTRGCVCNRKSCVRFCCRKPTQILEHGVCIDSDETDVHLPIKNRENEVSTLNFKDHLYYVNFLTCAASFVSQDDLVIHHV